jgi:hypothetical protein
MPHGTYARFVAVGADDREFIVKFGWSDRLSGEPASGPETVASVTLAPKTALELHALLGDLLQKWQDRFGPIIMQDQQIIFESKESTRS